MTPLNAILGNTELLLDGSAGPLLAQARACVADIQGAGQDLRRRHRTLLLLVQALSVERLATTGPIDLRPILEQASRDADRHGRLTFGPEAGCLRVEGDAYWLDALARTLLHLCREAGADPGALGADPSGDGRLRLRWPGFDPDRLEPIGLALVERIMALHGGAADRSSGSGIDLIFPTRACAGRAAPKR